MNRMAPPSPPPILGYGGANPMRAVQGMTGGINRVGAAPFTPVSPSGPVIGLTPPTRRSVEDFNPLSVDPKTFISFTPSPQTRLTNAVNNGGVRPANNPITQGIAGTGTMTPATTGFGGVGGPRTGTTAYNGVVELGSNAIQPINAPPDQRLASAASAMKPAANAIANAFSAPSTMAPGSTGYGNGPGQRPAVNASATGSGAQDKFGFAPSNAADPNRALRMMRGY